MDELNGEEKAVVFESRLLAWRRELEGLRLDMRVAEALDDEAMRERIRGQTKRAVTAIETLQSLRPEDAPTTT